MASRRPVSKIVYWYRQLRSIRKVSKKLKIRSCVISDILHKRGIRKKKKKISNEDLEPAVIYWFKKFDYVNKTAAKLGVGLARVVKILKKNNIPIRTGKKAERRPDMSKAQAALFHDHIYLVKIAIKSVGVWRAYRAGMGVDDLYNAGLVGLWRATMSFKPSLGCAFNTLAHKIIRYEMLDAIEVSRFGRRNVKGNLIDQSAFLPYDELQRDDDDEY